MVYVIFKVTLTSASNTTVTNIQETAQPEMAMPEATKPEMAMPEAVKREVTYHSRPSFPKALSVSTPWRRRLRETSNGSAYRVTTNGPT